MGLLLFLINNYLEILVIDTNHNNKSPLKSLIFKHLNWSQDKKCLRTTGLEYCHSLCWGFVWEGFMDPRNVQWEQRSLLEAYRKSFSSPRSEAPRKPFSSSPGCWCVWMWCLGLLWPPSYHLEEKHTTKDGSDVSKFHDYSNSANIFLHNISLFEYYGGILRIGGAGYH